MTSRVGRFRRAGDNSVAENLKEWDEDHVWDEGGDEWKGQAARCGVSYEQWKQSLIQHLIVPYVGPDAVVLEIGPGHGRWTEKLLEQPCSRLVLVDLSPTCLEMCRSRFSDPRLETFQTPGDALPPDCTESVDLVWSYDSFVHVAATEFRRYLAEIYRVLRPGGVAILHHANRRQSTLWMGGLRSVGDRGRRLYQVISMGRGEDSDGWRSNVSAKDVSSWIGDSGLVLQRQFTRWSVDDPCGVPRFGDRISIMTKPNEP